MSLHLWQIESLVTFITVLVLNKTREPAYKYLDTSRSFCKDSGCCGTRLCFLLAFWFCQRLAIMRASRHHVDCKCKKEKSIVLSFVLWNQQWISSLVHSRMECSLRRVYVLLVFTTSSCFAFGTNVYRSAMPRMYWYWFLERSHQSHRNALLFLGLVVSQQLSQHRHSGYVSSDC